MANVLHRGLNSDAMKQRARDCALPEPIPAWIAQVVTSATLTAERRQEVFDELVDHFLEGIAAGKTAEALMEEFGSAAESAALLHETKRVLTPESLGGAPTVIGLVTQAGRDAIRELLGAPIFTVAAVVLLAFGIGTNTAIFSLVNEIILRRPAFTHQERLVDASRSDATGAQDGLSEPDIADARKLTSVFSGVASTRMTWVWHDAGEINIRLTGEAVSADYFRVLGLHPLLGRFIDPDDAPAPGQGAVVVLGERTWRTVFGGDPGIVGRTLRLNGTAFRVLGVATTGYPGRLRAFPTDVFVPVTMIDQLERTVPSQLEDRRNGGTFATFQLQPGVSLAEAQSAMDGLARELRARQLPQWEAGTTVSLIPQSRVIIDPAVDRVIRPVAAMLMVVGILVLLVVCANLAGLRQARANPCDNATRVASKIRRSQMLTQALIETTVIALVAGVLGTVYGRAGLQALLGSDIPFPIPMDLQLSADWRVTTFALFVSLIAGVASGLSPALAATAPQRPDQLPPSAGRRRNVLQQFMVAGQVASAMVLLVMATLFARSFEAARRVDPGFGRSSGALVWLGGRPDRTGAALGRLVHETAQLPGVTAVGLTSLPHLNPIGTQSIEITVPGITPPRGRRGLAIDAAGIDTGYVAAIGLQLLAGRNILSKDRDVEWHTALVNEEFTRQFFPGRSGLGERFHHDGREVEIVGIVNTAKIRSLGEAAQPFIYYPGTAAMDWLVLRTTDDPLPALAGLQRAVNAADAGFYVAQVNTIATFVGTQAYPFKLVALLLTGLALAALVMSSIGVYGAASNELARRHQGHAMPPQSRSAMRAVTTLLFVNGLRVVGIGLVAGLCTAVLIGRHIEGLLFGVRAFDPLTMIGMPIVLAVATCLATYLSARKIEAIGARMSYP